MIYAKVDNQTCNYPFVPYAMTMKPHASATKNALPFLSGKRLSRFEALQAALVPRSRQFSEAQRAQSRVLVNSLVGNMPAANRKKLGLFLVIIDAVSFFFGFRTFRNLSAAKQRAVLQWLFDNPVGLLRKGFWGLNTLAKMGVYGQSSVYDDIGYHVRPNPGEEAA